jgi:dTDP-glucose 4,6-dehydratase
VRVLITGGRGFAGRHTIDHFLKTTNWDIVTLERPNNMLLLKDRVVRLPHDLRGPIPSWLDESIGHVDAVVHLAASADVHEFLKNPTEHVHNNVNGALHLLEWARGRRLDHFLLVSTNEVYGPTRLDFDYYGDPEWSGIAPPTPYSGSKAAQEALAISWWRTYGVPVVITNTMQLFGEGQPAERFIPRVVDSLLRKIPVHVYAHQNDNGIWSSASRCWTHVRNHADALRWVLERPAELWPDSPRPARWNVAGPEYTCEALVLDIAYLLGIEPDIKFIESDKARPGHELRYALDTSRIFSAGWKPPIAFKEALADTVHELALRPRGPMQ